MNPAEIKQIVETIKTLNVNINDATTQKIADAIIPVVQLYLIKEYVSMFLAFILAIVGFVVLYKIVVKIIESKRRS